MFCSCISVFWCASRGFTRGIAVVGSFLGDLTDELSGDGSRYIEEFVCTGPKSYAYRDQLGRVTCKFKGITKTLYNLNLVNLESMLHCIQEGVVHVPREEIPDKDKPKNLIFKLNRFGHIKTYYQLKVFRMVYDKRWIGPDYETFPWGY